MKKGVEESAFAAARAVRGVRFCKGLVAAFVSCCLTMTAWCASGTWWDETHGAQWDFDYDTGTHKATITGGECHQAWMVIPEEVWVDGDATPYVVNAIADNAFNAALHPEVSALTGVSIPSSVENIGRRAFRGWDNLAYLELGYDPELAHGVQQILDGAFQNSPKLGTVEIPRSMVFIGDTAFSDCATLATVAFKGAASAITVDPLAAFADTPFVASVNANDDWANAIEISGEAGRVSGCNILATKETGEPAFPDLRSMWWKWKAPAGVAKVAFYTYGSSFDTQMGVYTGSAVDALSKIAENDERSSSGSSFVSFDVTPNETYYICVGGFAWSPSGTINLAWETTNDPFSLVIADRAVIGFIGDCPESVEVPYAVTNVEAYAFDHRIDASVDNIKSVVIPESVVKIGVDAFYECSNLASVTFVNEEVFVEMRPASAFFNTPYLTSLNGNDKFANAIELTGGRGCVMGWNGDASLETGEPLSLYHNSLWWKWKAPAGVTKAVFHTYGSDFDTVLGVYTGVAVDALSEVVPLSDDYGMWSGCDANGKSLVSFDVAPGVEYYICVAGSGSYAYDGTVRLGWTTCGSGGFSFLTSDGTLLGFVGDCFEESLTIPDTVTKIEQSAFEYVYYGTRIDNLKKLVIPEGVTSIGEYAFYCDKLTSVVIPASVVEIGVQAFENCTDLSSVTFEGDVNDIDMDPLSVFNGTPFLASVNKNDHWADAIELTGGKGNTTAWNAFATPEAGEPMEKGKRTLWWKWTAPAGKTKVLFHTYGSEFDTILGVYTGTAVDALTEVAYDDDRGGKTSFVSFDVTPGETYYICVAGYRGNQRGAVELTWETATAFSLVIVDGTLIGFIGECPSSLTIPNTVRMIGDSAFDKICDTSVSKLKSVVIPGSVTNIGYAAFYWCDNLSSVTFSEGLLTIERSAFCDCEGLKGQTITLPTTVENVEEDAFWSVGDELTLLLPRSLNGMLASGMYGTTDLTVGYYVKATLDPNGGTLTDRERVIYGDVYGDLSPLPTRTGYTFKGWKNGSTAITATTPLPKVATLKLTAQWQIVKETVTLDLGGGTGSGSVAVNYGTRVSDIPVPTRERYEFLGWYAEDGTPISGDTLITADLKLFARWKADYFLYEAVGDAVPSVALTYDGYLYSGEELAGTITVKVGKPNRAGLASVKATLTLAGGKKILKPAGTGKVEMAKDGPTTIALMGGDACEVTFGSDGMKGTYGSYGIDGARNVFVTKDSIDKSLAGEALRAWQGAVTVAWRRNEGDAFYETLGVSIAAKGRATVSGTLSDGTKVSAKGQLIVGEEWCCVPVLVTKKTQLAFTLWLPLSGDSATSTASPGVLGLGSDVKMDKPRYLKGDPSEFHIDAAAFNAMWGKTALPYLPDGVPVKGSVKWDLPKAGKVVYVKGTTTVDETKLGDNPSALKLKYKSKSGTFSGSFKAYEDVGGKPKSTTVNVAGVLVDGVGYGTATIKNVGSVPITLE